jgi:small-conductance mechanosensitive channel
MTAALIVLVGLCLWLALAGIRRLPRLLSFSTELQARVRSAVPALSLSAWLLYGIWAIIVLAPADAPVHLLILGAVAILLLLFSWFVLRDLVAGIVFAARHPGLDGVQIQAGAVTGRVVHTGVLGIALRGEGGERISLPYSALAGATLVEQPPERSADEFRTRLAIPGDANGEEAGDDLRRRLLLLPWVNPVRPPTVQVSGSGRDRVAEVVYHCLSEEHALHVDEYLRQHYQRPSAGEEEERSAS